jgi:hypothetical protein
LLRGAKFGVTLSLLTIWVLSGVSLAEEPKAPAPAPSAAAKPSTASSAPAAPAQGGEPAVVCTENLNSDIVVMEAVVIGNGRVRGRQVGVVLYPEREPLES